MHPSIITPSSISVFLNGKPHNIHSDHPNFGLVKDAIREERWDDVPGLIDVAKAVETYALGKVEVRDGVVHYNGQPLHNVVTERILQMMREGFKVDPLIRFLEKLLANPSRTAVQELYLFLESGKLPLTEDGDFLAYKKVREDYKDVYSGRFDNSVGQVCQVPRNEVDDQRDRTCSYGLHFCSRDYLRSFSGSRVMVVKINPADVVSIPSDYNNTKGRTCRYEVVGELEQDFTHDDFEQPVYYYDDDDDVDDEAAPEWEAELVALDEDGNVHTKVVRFGSNKNLWSEDEVRDVIDNWYYQDARDQFGTDAIDETSLKVRSIREL